MSSFKEKYSQFYLHSSLLSQAASVLLYVLALDAYNRF